MQHGLGLEPARTCIGGIHRGKKGLIHVEAAKHEKGGAHCMEGDRGKTAICTIVYIFVWVEVSGGVIGVSANVSNALPVMV